MFMTLSPKFIYWSAITLGDGIRRWDLGERTQSWGWCLCQWD
jgi:hypothetical protein